MNNATLDALDALIRDADNEIIRFTKRKKELQLERARLLSPVKRGDVFLHKPYSNAEAERVVCIRVFSQWGNCTISIAGFKKDGSPSKANRSPVSLWSPHLHEKKVIELTGEVISDNVLKGFGL